MAIEKLKIEFGQPEHGWLPVHLRHGDFELHFRASNVPVNPIDQLISGIKQITKGITTEVWWHLEPEGYHFIFDREADAYKLSISFAKRDKAHKELVHETKGTYEDIVMPFYRSIKIFITRTTDKSHWPKTDYNEIENLTNEVKGS